MNWGTMGPALGSLLGAGAVAAALPTGGLSLAALPAIAAGGALGGTAGGIGGQLAGGQGMPPPQGPPPGQKPMMPPSTPMAQQGMGGLFGGIPGQKGFLNHPFAGV